MNRILLFTLLAATAAIAGPYDQPYSIIVTDPAPSADPDLRPVIVNRVDGENSVDNRAVVPPGPHKVTIDLPPRRGYRTATQHTFDLTTRACVRYYVAAKLDNPVSQRWVPVVRSEERIVECERRFNVAAAK